MQQCVSVFVFAIFLPALANGFLPYSLSRINGPAFEALGGVTRKMMDRASQDSSEVSGTAAEPERFKMVYTCNVCKSRNMLDIQRLAWDQGVVISTCQGCQNRHILSDAKGITDIGNWTKFSNVVNAKNATTLNIPGMDAAALEALGLSVGEDGTVQLVPRAGEELLKKTHRISAVGKIYQEADDESSVDSTATPGGVAAAAAAAAEAVGGGSADNDSGASGAIEITVPSGAGPGDMLLVSTSAGSMRVLVPDGALGGSVLAIEGSIEFMVQADKVGEMVLLETPEGGTISFPIPADAAPGSILQVASPVRVTSTPLGGGRD